MKPAKDISTIEQLFSNRPKESLRGEALQGGAIAITTRGLTTIIQMGGTLVLARLLTPQDFGLVAMVMAISEILFLFRDVGLSDATIQASTISHKQVSTLFWINWAICIGIAVILIALSPAVVWFYKDTKLLHIMMVSSVSYIFWGLSFQHIALLKRNMLFLRVGIIGILAQFVSTLLAIILAWGGFGYWSIVFRDILFSIATFTMAWALCKWRPGMPGKLSEVSSMLKFGANSAGYYLVNYFAKNLDKIIIGKRFGSVQLGLYSKAYYLSTNPAGQISNALFHVSVSTLSKLRDNHNTYKRYYLNALATISFLGMPLSVIMVLMREELILVLLGPQWKSAADIFSILGLAAGMNILNYTCGWLHASLGRSDRWLKWGIISSTLLSIAFIGGSFFGLRGIAWGYAITIILLTFPAILFAGKPIGLRFDHVFSIVWKSIVGAVVAGLLFNFTKISRLFDMPVFFKLVLSLIIYMIIYVIIIAILYRGLTPFKEMLKISRQVFARKMR
jgi:O-antigen/teichoic acid export membrane protein